MLTLDTSFYYYVWENGKLCLKYSCLVLQYNGQIEEKPMADWVMRWTRHVFHETLFSLERRTSKLLLTNLSIWQAFSWKGAKWAGYFKENWHFVTNDKICTIRVSSSTYKEPGSCHSILKTSKKLNRRKNQLFLDLWEGRDGNTTATKTGDTVRQIQGVRAHRSRSCRGSQCWRRKTNCNRQIAGGSTKTTLKVKISTMLWILHSGAWPDSQSKRIPE